MTAWSNATKQYLSYSSSSHDVTVVISSHRLHLTNIITLRASQAAAQCIVIGPVCGFVCVFLGVFVCGSVTTITRNCVHRSSPNWVCR